MQVGYVGHLVGIRVNVGLPLFLLCVGSSSDDVTRSCFYRRIHRGRLGLAQRYRGDLVCAVISLRSSKALNTDWDKRWVKSDKHLEIERHLREKKKEEQNVSYSIWRERTTLHYWVNAIALFLAFTAEFLLVALLYSTSVGFMHSVTCEHCQQLPSGP